MIIRAAEVRVCLRDADLQSLLEGQSYGAWMNMTEGVAGEWYGGLGERIEMVASEIAGRAARRWPTALDGLLEREALGLDGYARLRDVHSDDWRRRLDAFRAERVKVSMEPRHVLDGVLPSIVLAAAIIDALEGTPEVPAPEEPETSHDALALAAAFFGTRKVSHKPDGAPRARGLARLASAIGQLRWADGARAKALVSDGNRLARRAGEALLGTPAKRLKIEAEPRDDGVLVLIDGRDLLRLASETLTAIAPLIPSAAATRLRELAPEDESHALLAEALASVPARRAVMSLLGLPSSVTPTGTLNHHSRLYEAVPHGPRPHTVMVSSARGLETPAVAMADGDGAHVGYAALDPLSRETHGRPLRAVYDLEGRRRGRLQEDEAGWRFLEGDPIGGFRNAPAHLPPL